MRPAPETRPSAPVEGKAPGTESVPAAEGRRQPSGTKRPLLRSLDIEHAQESDGEEECVDEEEESDDDDLFWTLFGVVFFGATALVVVVAFVAIVRAAPPRSAQHTARTVQYACPAARQKSLNDKDDDLEDWYDEQNACVYANGGAALAAIRNGTCAYDGGSTGYAAKKESIRAWKEAAFLPHVRDGAAIYESACGIGLNMLLTAEILHEHGVRNLTFYGNDYSARSVATANRFWDDPHVGAVAASKGRICRADSSDLAGVPDGAFDFAYTGYLAPLENPFDIDVDDDGARSSVGYCKSDPELAAREQAAMEVWAASWVSELVRIAKPDGYVAIESGAESWCSAHKGWGGVDKGWWGEETIAKYQWDVDPRSVLVMDGPKQRYHVLLKKNGA